MALVSNLFAEHLGAYLASRGKTARDPRDLKWRSLHSSWSSSKDLEECDLDRPQPQNPALYGARNESRSAHGRGNTARNGDDLHGGHLCGQPEEMCSGDLGGTRTDTADFESDLTGARQGHTHAGRSHSRDRSVAAQLTT